MVNKQEYIQLRKQNRIHFGLALELYINTEHPTPKLHQQQFLNIFPVWLQHFGSNMELYFNYYDSKFEVIKVIGVDGNILYF